MIHQETLWECTNRALLLVFSPRTPSLVCTYHILFRACKSHTFTRVCTLHPLATVCTPHTLPLVCNAHQVLLFFTTHTIPHVCGHHILFLVCPPNNFLLVCPSHILYCLHSSNFPSSRHTSYPQSRLQIPQFPSCLLPSHRVNKFTREGKPNVLYSATPIFEYSTLALCIRMEVYFLTSGVHGCTKYKVSLPPRSTYSKNWPSPVFILGSSPFPPLNSQSLRVIILHVICGPE